MPAIQRALGALVLLGWPVSALPAADQQAALSPAEKASTTASAAATIHHGRGVIRAIKDGGRVLLVQHERIPGFMPAMTMDFALADPALAKGFKVGDAVDFTLTKKGNFWPITRLQRRAAATAAPAKGSHHD